MSDNPNQPPRLRLHESRFNPPPKKIGSNLPPTAKMSLNNSANNPKPAPPPSSAMPNPPAASSNPPGQAVPNPPAPPVSQPAIAATPALAPASKTPTPPVANTPQSSLLSPQSMQALVQVTLRPLNQQQVIVEEARVVESPRKKKKWRFWKLYLFGMPILLGGLVTGLFLWESTRYFMFSFFSLNAAEARYYSETTQLNTRLDTALTQTYTQLLNSTTANQQETAYKALYNNLGEVTTRFLATESPSFRFSQAHQSLQKSYIQLELISKRVLADLNQNFKNINRQTLLAELDTIRKNYERAKRELKTAANF